MKVLLGLGNPGKKYAGTRHNLGFAVVAWLAEHNPGEPLALRLEKKFEALVAPIPVTGLLVQPQTFVNLSGQAAAAILGYYDIPPSDLLVICDDVNLELGKLRFRTEGTAGGHNGLKSIIASLTNENFPRLRLGVGAPKAPEGAVASAKPPDLTGHVLGRFPAAEKETVARMVESAGRFCWDWLDGREKHARAWIV
jgi:PTH1 family peptidyl-tRNA hydrolase